MDVLESGRGWALAVDFRGDWLRIEPLVTFDDVLEMPWRHDKILSAPCELRRLRLLPFVAIDAVRPSFRFENTDEVSQLSVLRLFHAQSCLNTLIRPARSAVTMMFPVACVERARYAGDSSGRL
jgi:hypothetical protein